MAAERELAELDEQFSGLISAEEMEEAMQIHGADDEVVDTDEAFDDADDMLNDDMLGDEAFDMGEEFDDE